MEFDKITCTKCKEVKLRHSLGKLRYIDETGKFWRSRCCPDCSRKYSKKYRIVNNLLSNFNKNAICSHCNKHFIKQTFNSSYCSDFCLKERNLNYYRNKQSYKGIRKPRQLITQQCNMCFKSYEYFKIRKFCSNTCRFNHIHKNKKIKEKIITNCLICFISFEQKGNNKKYCSSKCSLKASKQKHKKKRKAYDNTRELKKIQRVPAWADLKAINNFYNSCPTGYHVDHIIPLNGKQVSGLHVENNLQYLSSEDNILKSNKFDGTEENTNWKK